MPLINRRVKEMAAQAGFDLSGVAPAGELVPEGERLTQWLNAGNHGAMSWMERHLQLRKDPREVMPGTRSVIAVALNYFTPHEHSAEGKISRYAWGDDYHDIMRERLQLLLDLIKSEWPDVRGRICVDTAPVMDKAWAVRAGLGWLGKHSNVITKELGSWVFLGEILVDQNFDEYDEPIVDHCGTCTRCLDACPTQAITAPYVVDSRRCISYGTIELRDETLPPVIGENLDGWLYGCDICQDVCPWNRFERPTEEKRFEPRLGETSLPPDEILSMTHEEYVERFRRSAIKRAKLGGLKRNASYLKEAK